MPYVDIPGARLWYDTAGEGAPLVCLHSGWGRAAMPFDDAVAVLGASRRLIFPDRRGYGRSTPVEHLPPIYHREAMADLLAFLDAVGLERATLWGHSDGAITSALLAAEQPARVSGLVLEAIHFRRAKSPEFFLRYERDPDSLPDAVKHRLASEHGERWRTVVRMHSAAWRELFGIGGDFYEGRLERIVAPTLVVSGDLDPHTPPTEVAELAAHFRTLVEVERFAEGGHSPHSEPRTARLVSERVARFLAEHGV
jgi:pimeloyl-ACP methyl ester carboxylesterase